METSAPRGAIAEMLVQSTEGTVELLPALPKVWRKASLTDYERVEVLK